ncbi:hypothetical protein ACSBR1_023380 [Camellia fascicularis]
MAEESFNTSVTPEMMEIDGGDLRRISVGRPSNSRRNSTGKLTTPNNGQNAGQNVLPHHIRASIGSCRDVVNLRRNATGIPSSPNSGESVTPHYLRASTGSCHDFCKYGRKHEFDVKPRRPIPKRRITPPSNKQIPTELGVPAVRKTTTKVKPKLPHVSKTLSVDSPSFTKKEVSSPSKKVDVSSRQASSNEEKIAQNEQKKNLSEKSTLVKLKTMIVKLSSSTDASGGLIGRKNSEIKVAKQTGTSKAAVKKKIASPVASLSPKPSSGRRSSEIKVSRQAGTSKAAAKTILESPAASLSPKRSINRVVSLNVQKYRSAKLVSPLKDQNRIRKSEPRQPDSEMVPEKTLHVIKVETENKVLEPSQYGSSIDSPLSPTLSSPKSSSLPKSPALSFHEEETQEETEYTDIKVETENKVLESTTLSPTLSLPKSLSLPESPAFSFHEEEEAQEESEYTDIEVETEKKVLESAIHSPLSPTLPSPKSSTLQKSPALSFHEEEVQEESESTDNEVETEKKVLESAQYGSAIHSPLSPTLSSPKSSTLQKSPTLSFHEGEAQEESESTDIEVETEKKVLESAQYGSAIHSPLSLILSSPKSSSLPKSPALSFHEEDAQEESEYTDSEVDEADDSVSESSETANLNEVETSKGNHKRTPRKADDKDCAPEKLKFRRGKVVDLQSENSGPRRLRFRRGRVLGENQDSNSVRKRSFKNRRIKDDTNGTDPDSEKVVLRHQDVQGKKDAQGLFNNVIEETASKLVESRKSKVKALVGAFETVISLQESKPST